MGRSDKKGVWSYTADGFTAVRVLDNGNIYGVMVTEMISNIFKEGMWFKALTPYMLILTNNDAVQVGNMLTLNGITRAFVGVCSGRMAINTYGVEAVWVVTGFLGLLSILTNVVCLCKGSVPAAYFLNFAWAVYNGLWNSCLETSWARSVVKSKREDVNGARQITNKVTTSLGPLFSAAIFLWFGNSWNIELVQNVMLFGTMMTTFTVMLCFCFRSSQEIEQDVFLRSVKKFIFSDPKSSTGCKEFNCSELAMSDFKKEDSGVVRLTYPIGLGHDDEEARWDSRIVIVTKDFQETSFILAKQFHATFSGIPSSERSCLLLFEDRSRPPELVTLHSVQVFLGVDAMTSVNRSVSRMHFSLKPQLDGAPPKFSVSGVLSKLILGRGLSPRQELRRDTLEEALLPLAISEHDPSPTQDIPAARSVRERVLDKSVEEDEKSSVNMLGANVIVVCDVLNALGAGFSLKFMDLFLKVDYGVSPATVFFVAFLQNIFGAWLTPWAKALLSTMRKKGYRAKLGVVMLWSLALVFLGLLCIPGMPIWVVIPSIVMMQSLNSCTRAYNRAQLVNYLPREKIVNYMTWDALNKANQGGVAIFGAQIVALGGYRACFVGTFIILSIRTLIYLAFTLRKGTLYSGRGKEIRKLAVEREHSASMTGRSTDEITAEDMDTAENIRPVGVDGEESQMFQQADALSLFSERLVSPGNVQVVDMDQVFRSKSGGGVSGMQKI